jgi:hypothetical protein
MKDDWPEELRRRGLEAGYGDVLVGQCDVEGTDATGHCFCGKPHREGPYLRGKPAIWALLEDMGLPMASGSCHWACFDRGRLTTEQKAALAGRRYWVREREDRYKGVGT